MKTTQADGTFLEKTYLGNGLVATEKDAKGNAAYYQYDGLNRLSKQWTPFETVSGTMQYAYKAFAYDKSGRQLMISSGKEAVPLYSIPSTFSTQRKTYYKNGTVQSQQDSDGRKTDYFYDADNVVIKVETYTSATDNQTTEFINNHLGKPVTQKVWVRKGDLVGNSATDDAMVPLISTFTYDGNGNLITQTTPDDVTTTFAYDHLNRLVISRYTGVDEFGLPAVIEVSKELDWGGRPLTETDAIGNTKTNVYDEQGLLVQTTAPDGGITRTQYDLANRKVLEISPLNYDSSKTASEMTKKTYEYDLLGRLLKAHDIWYNPETSLWEDIVATAYLYDANGNVTKKLDALGYEAGSGVTHSAKALSGKGIEYTYNAANLCITERDPVTKERNLLFTKKTTYDALGRSIAIEDAKGNVSRSTLNDNGLSLTTTIQPSGSSTETTLQTNTWDLAGNLLSSTDANGNTTTYTYTAFNKPRTVVLPGDASIGQDTQNSQYDVQFNVEKTWNSLGETALFTYDHAGYLLLETRRNATGDDAITKSQAWDANGNLRFIVDGNGNEHEKTYNNMNQLAHETTTVGTVSHTTTYTRDLNGNETTVTDWLGNTSTNVYDALNRLVERIDSNNNTVESIEYNHVHIQTASENALGQRTAFAYDSNNRLLSTTNPEMHIVSQTYDNNGNISSKTDGRGKTTEYSYDAQNRLVSVENDLGETTTYLLDTNGNLLEQEDGNGHVTTFEYNARNLPIRRIDDDGRTGTPGSYTYVAAKTEVYSYDSSGRMVTRLDRNGNTTTWVYDCHGRVLNETVAGNAVSRTWDGNNNVLTMTDSTGTTTWAYDELNRTLTKEAPVVGTLTYTWDILSGVPAGHVKQRITDSANNLTDTVLDRLGRITQVISGSSTATYTYTLSGNRESIVYNNGSREDYTYTDDGLLESLVNKRGDGTVIDSYSYTYDAAHNQTAKVDAKGETEYTYDNLNRLKTVTEPNGRVTTYTFDDAGNRLTEQVVLGSTTTLKTSTYNEQNRLTGIVTKINGIITETRVYSWDNGGNLLTTTVNGQLTVSNAYDVRNQLVETETADTTIENAYNGDGLRVSKTIDGEVEFYLLNGDKVVLELDDSGTTIRRNVYGVNLVLSQIGSTSYQYLYNGHADVTALILPNGQVAGTWYYDAFGVQTEHTGVDSMYTYSGYRYDDETGLYYLNARMYDPEMARFLQEDTYRGQANDPLSLNLYVYCHNEPLMYWDPTGHSWKEVGEWFGEAYRDITDFVEIPLDVKLCKAVDGILAYSYDNATQAGDSISRAVDDPTFDNFSIALNRTGNYLLMGMTERFGNAFTIYTDGHSGTVYKTKAFTIEHFTATTWSALDITMMSSVIKEGFIPKSLSEYKSFTVPEGNVKTWKVDPAMQASDEATGVLKNGSYIKNPTAQNINSLVKDGSNYVGNSKFNGQYMYVVDNQGNIIIGSRAGQHMPHPTLVGGANPQVQAAGIVDIRGGKIFKIDNASGHFKPGVGSLESAKDVFGNLPSNVFSKDFQGYVPYGK